MWNVLDSQSLREICMWKEPRTLIYRTSSKYTIHQLNCYWQHCLAVRVGLNSTRCALRMVDDQRW
jgi:hypothetical protein